MNGVSAPAPELPGEDEVDEVDDDVRARGQLQHGQRSRRRPMSNQGNVKVTQQTPIMMCFGKSYIAQAALVGFWSAVAVAFLARAFLGKAEKQRHADATAFGTTFVVVAVTTFARLQRRRRERSLSQQKNLPAEIPSSLLAAAPWGNIRDLLKVVIEWLRRRDGVARLQPPLGKPFILVNQREALRSILVTHTNDFTKDHAFGVIETFRKTRLSDGRPAWAPVHKLASSFARKGADKASLKLEESLARFIRRTLNDSSSAGTVDLAAGLRDMYWGITLHLVLGANPTDPHFAGSNGIYAQAWHAVIRMIESPLVNAIHLWQYLPTPGNLFYRYACARLRRRVHAIVRADGDPAPGFTIARALQLDSTLNDADRLEIAMEFLFTGTVSVTSMALMLLWHLACEPEHQARARQSIEEGLGTLRAPTLEEAGRNSFPHLERCLKESLRLYSPICIGRKAVRDHTLPDGRHIPAGSDVAANAWLVHHDPSVWPNPDAFDPSRFESGRESEFTSGAYMPFSLGRRGCPGQPATYSIVKFLVAGILARVELTAPSPDPPEFMPSLILPNTPACVKVCMSALTTK